MSKQFENFDLYIKKLISVAINDHIEKNKTKKTQAFIYIKMETDMSSCTAKFTVVMMEWVRKMCFFFEPGYQFIGHREAEASIEIYSDI